MPRYSWPAAICFVAVVSVTESLPLVAGRGVNARFDWSFIYITLHFVLLPLAAGIHIFWNLGALALRRTEKLRSRVIAASSVTIPLIYLGLLFLRPVFPFWAERLWESYAATPPWSK
jgi:hypothetical protein